MYCPNCKQEFEGKFCPECGTKLIEKPINQGGFNIKLGDANAISGGINLSDSHDVHNTDNSVHNTTNNSSIVNNNTDNSSVVNNNIDKSSKIYNTTNNHITNNTSNITNITNVAAQKTDNEILQERKIEFMETVSAVFADGILEQDEIDVLEQERIRIGLDEITAKRLIETARRNVSNVRQSLSSTQLLALKQIERLTQTNNTNQLLRLLPRLETIAKNTLEERPHFIYYSVAAAVNPIKLIQDYESLSADDYWQMYWAYIAYTKMGDFRKAEDILFSLERYTQYSEENISLLSVLGALREFGKDAAKDVLNTVTGMYSELLNQFALSLYMLIDPDNAVELGATEEECAFYLMNLLAFEDEEAKRRRETEQAALAAAEASKLFTLEIVAPGNNSFKVAMVLKSSVGISLSEAKAILECCPIDIIKKSGRDVVFPVSDKLKNAGAIIKIKEN